MKRKEPQASANSSTPLAVVRMIMSQIEELRASEKKVARYVLSAPDKVIYQSIGELAENAGVSEPTVLRFCRALGLGGYYELKIGLAQDLVPEVKNIHEDVQPGDDAATLARKVFNANVIAINTSLDILDPARLARAIEILDASRLVEFFGLGGSAAVAMDACHKFFRLGLTCVWRDDSHMQAMSAAMMDKGCALVVISHSGSSKDVVECLEAAKQAGAATIAIVSRRKSPVAAAADVPICVHARETSFKPEPMSSRIAQLCVVDALAVGLAIRRREAFVANLRKTRKALVRKRY